MRLIDVNTFEFKEFLGANIPPYAILSHRWEDEEVTYGDIITQCAASKKGFRKLQSLCHQAVKRNLQYVWMDTCCIDKSSSAELTEAINSMYRWYQHADECYVYLCDFQYETIYEKPSKIARHDDGTTTQVTLHRDTNQALIHDQAQQDYDPYHHTTQDNDTKRPTYNFEAQLTNSSFASSGWFRRGWTLQELIAPRIVRFYNQDWRFIGVKSCFPNLLSAITSIPVDLLEANMVPHRYSIAQRMSWAAKRETTRAEDRAYCLLGMFGVSMPLLYGEGNYAFIRLQHEIIKRVDDMSFLLHETPGTPRELTVFAESPSSFPVLEDFATGNRIISGHLYDWDVDEYDRSHDTRGRALVNIEPLAVNATGIVMNLTLIPWTLNRFLVMVYDIGFKPHFIILMCDHSSVKSYIRVSYNGQPFLRASTAVFEHFSSAKLVNSSLAFRDRISITNTSTGEDWRRRLGPLVTPEFTGAKFGFKQQDDAVWTPASDDTIVRVPIASRATLVPFNNARYELFAIFRFWRASSWWYLCIGLNQRALPFYVTTKTLPNEDELSTTEPSRMTDKDIDLVLQADKCLELAKSDNFTGTIGHGSAGSGTCYLYETGWRFPESHKGYGVDYGMHLDFRGLRLELSWGYPDGQHVGRCDSCYAMFDMWLEMGPEPEAPQSGSEIFSARAYNLLEKTVSSDWAEQIALMGAVYLQVLRGGVNGWVLSCVCIYFWVINIIDETKIARLDLEVQSLLNVTKVG